MIAVRIVLLLLGLFFSLMAIGGFISSYEDFKNRKNKNYKAEYKMKLLFTIIPLMFWTIFLRMGLTIEL